MAADILDALSQAERLLEEVDVEHQGGPIPEPPPEPLFARRVKAQARVWAEAAGRELACVPADAEPARAFCSAMICASMKIGGVIHELDADGTIRRDHIMEDYAIPKVMIIERELASARAAVDALAQDWLEGAAVARLRAAQDELERLLEPTIACVSDEDRRCIDQLVAQGRAPSPFATVAGKDPYVAS